jgi:dipeptidase
MKRLLLIGVLLAAIVTVLAVAAQAASAAPSAKTHDDCNFIVAGKDATADGSVLMGYNNDWDVTNYTYLKVIPSPGSGLHQYVQVLTEGDWPEGGINDHQLSVCYGVATDIAAKVEKADPYLDDGWGYEMWDNILQQCANADQAINLVQQMATSRGFNGDAAGSYALADHDKAWVIEVYGGHHWAAARVPDNAFYEQPNMLRIRQIDLSKPSKFRGSPDLVQFATSLGRYKPSDGPFDCAWAFGNRTDLQDSYNTYRLWGALHKVAPSQQYDPSMPYASRPVFVVPDHKLTRQDFAGVLRYHYEGTSLDLTQNYVLGSPHLTDQRTICYQTTDYSAVFQMRDWLPDAVGGVIWLALSRPCSSAYVPVYDSVTSVPAALGDATAYNDFTAVAESLDADGTVHGQVRYHYYIPLVRGTYGALESSEASSQTCVESHASCLPPSQRAAYLTDYTSDRALQAQGLAQTLIGLMP